MLIQGRFDAAIWEIFILPVDLSAVRHTCMYTLNAPSDSSVCNPFWPYVKCRGDHQDRDKTLDSYLEELRELQEPKVDRHREPARWILQSNSLLAHAPTTFALVSNRKISSRRFVSIAFWRSLASSSCTSREMRASFFILRSRAIREPNRVRFSPGELWTSFRRACSFAGMKRRELRFAE
jgi:hypothetical protein